MNTTKVRVRELAGWGLDEDEYRPVGLDLARLDSACALVAARLPFEEKSAVFKPGDAALQSRFAEQRSRPDLHLEMAGLNWSLGIADLRLLLAFQRRLVLNQDRPGFSVPAPDDWPALMDLCFGSPKPVACEIVQSEASIMLRSADPNLHFRISGDSGTPIMVHAGSPFFEVAQYRGRWFLRDGYHRAFTCLRAGIFCLPAVIVQARTLKELGAVHPWFFSEEVLFSSSPPRVVDFLDDALVLEYDRSPLIKTLRITVEETYSLAGEAL
ncbi:MAG TPA: hypothetical protein VE178_15305 [Silvibacterium sp.]|jgi:hypothetical protein|nr:hypothetical protein [Silvibacterium sp.]